MLYLTERAYYGSPSLVKRVKLAPSERPVLPSLAIFPDVCTSSAAMPRAGRNRACPAGDTAIADDLPDFLHPLHLRHNNASGAGLTKCVQLPVTRTCAGTIRARAASRWPFNVSGLILLCSKSIQKKSTESTSASVTRGSLSVIAAPRKTCPALGSCRNMATASLANTPLFVIAASRECILHPRRS